MEPSRPSVSRETRLLLAIVLVSLSMLWVLARIRFPDRPATPNPVPPVLAQLAPPSALQDIASTITQLTPRTQGLLAPIEIRPGALAGKPQPPAFVPGLRVRDGLLVALGGADSAARTIAGAPVDIAARDPVSGVVLLRVAGTAPDLDAWVPSEEPYPRYLIGCEASATGISLRPVFIGAFHAIDSPFWPGRIWTMPPGTQLRSGTVLFTTGGELAGLAAERHGRVSLVPGPVLMAVVNRLAGQPARESGWLGVDVQALTADLAAAVHATTGVIVTWVDPRGPAAELLSPMDIIEQVNGKPVTSDEQWDAQVLGLAPGDAVTLAVRQDDDVRELQVSATRREPPPAPVTLGLSMRTIPRVGAEVIRVEEDGAAARAGIETGDVITAVGETTTPSAAQVSRAFAKTAGDRTLILILTRGQDHRIVSIRKQP